MLRIGLAVALAFCLCACSNSAQRRDAQAPKAPEVDLKQSSELGQAAYAAADWTAAEPHFRALVSAFPQQADLWFKLGNIYARTDRPDLAVTAYRESLVRNPDLGKAWFNMGVIQLRQAANSFNKVDLHAGSKDPARARAALAYQNILKILDSNGPSTGADRPVHTEPTSTAILGAERNADAE